VYEISNQVSSIVSRPVAQKRSGDENELDQPPPKRTKYKGRKDKPRVPLSPKPIRAFPSKYDSGFSCTMLHGLALPSSGFPSSRLSDSAYLRSVRSTELPKPVEILLGDLKNYASPPDLSIINARRNVDKIKKFVQNFPKAFKKTFTSLIPAMENGESITLSHEAAKNVLADLNSDTSKNYLYHLSQYAQIPQKYLRDKPQITITIDHAPRQYFQTTSLNKTAQACWDETWNGFNHTPDSLESELMSILAYTRFHETYPSNVSVEFEATDRHEARYVYFSTTSEPMNPSTMAWSDTTKGTLGMPKETPLSTFRLMDESGKCLMSGQLTPTGVFLLHTIDTKDTDYRSGEVIDLTLSIAKGLTAESIILYDAAKIYYPGKDQYYFYSKAMTPLILAGTKQAFYECADRGGFTYFEDSTAVLDVGRVLTFKGIKATNKKATLAQVFGKATMGKFKGLINKAMPYKDIPDDTPLLTHWTTLLSNYISEGRRWRDFSQLVTFLNDLTSIKDIPKSHPLFDKALQEAITLWARPEFYHLKLRDD